MPGATGTSARNSAVLCDAVSAHGTGNTSAVSGAGAVLGPPSAYTQESATIIHFPDGGASYNFTGPNGLIEHYPVPPRGFDPSTASPTELEEYGYPTRPAGGAALQQWLSNVGRVVPNSAPTTMLVATGSPPQASSSNLPGLPIDGSFLNWAGYVASEPSSSSTAIKGAYGTWVQPQSYAPTACPTADGTTWVGLGNGTTQGLAQAGLFMNNTTNSYPTSNEYWWEIYPYNYAQCVPIYGTAGHTYKVGVTWTNTATCGSESEFWFVWYDLTTGAGNAGYVCLGLPAGAAQAEWIVERPSTCNGCFTDLTQWQNPLQWTDFIDYDSTIGSWGPPYALTNPETLQGYTMVDSLNHTLATTGSYNSSNDSFTNSWVYCS